MQITLEKQFLDVSIEFGDQLIKYLRHFGLIEADIAKLVKSNTDDVRDILDGQKGVVLKTAEKISKVFGLRYFELGNPKFPLPKIKQLPQETQDVIQHRKDKGDIQIIRNYTNDIAGNLDKIIHETDLLHQPVTAEEIRLHFPEGIRDSIKATRITDLLKKSGRDKIVVRVSKKGREYLFQLKEYVGK